MKLKILLMLINIFILNVVGSEFKIDKRNSENDNKEVVLLMLDYDPIPKTMPPEWMERFLASTQSPRNYSRRKLIDLLKKKKISEH